MTRLDFLVTESETLWSGGAGLGHSQKGILRFALGSLSMTPCKVADPRIFLH